jgi:propionyl-CoA synthetase
MQKIADHQAWNMPATIDDASVLDEIEAAIRGRGIGV